MRLILRGTQSVDEGIQLLGILTFFFCMKPCFKQFSQVLGSKGIFFHYFRPYFPMWCTHGSRPVSCCILFKLLPVIERAHLPTIFATTFTSGMMLLRSISKNLINLPTNCCLTVMKSLASTLSTK